MASASAVSLDTVAAVIRRLQQLLQHAAAVKPETTVEPPLPSTDLLNEVDALHDDFTEGVDQVRRLFAVETAARRMFYPLVNSTPIDDPEFVQMWNFLDLMLLCGDRGKCTPELVCWLIEELLDSQTTDGCRVVFDYLESRRERLAQKDFHKKNLVFLRSCNELLRRLSRAEDAIFGGRVFFFLFQTFPLGDKSSVNLRGEFHVENSTHFDTTEPVNGTHAATDGDVAAHPAANNTTRPTSAKPGPASKADRKPLLPGVTVLPDSELYPIFWRLQHDFSDPTRLFEAQDFTAFKQGIASTVAKFDSFRNAIQAKVGDAGRQGTKRKLGEMDMEATNENHLMDNYNPKYLTSRDLFHLELNDLAFQRHICVQALILIDFLLSLTTDAKKKLDDLATPNKSLIYKFTLSVEDTEWAGWMKGIITTHLNESTEGRQYFRMVETVLARDRNWVRWKTESCPSIVRGPVSTEDEMAARKGTRDATRPRRMPERPMNAMNLSFLDRDGTGTLEALKDPSRYTPPTIQQLVDGIKTDRLDEDFAMDDTEKLGLQNAIANKRWRALRQARALDLRLLDKVNIDSDLEGILATRPSGGDDADMSIQSAEDGGEPAISDDRVDMAAGVGPEAVSQAS